MRNNNFLFSIWIFILSKSSSSFYSNVDVPSGSVSNSLTAIAELLEDSSPVEEISGPAILNLLTRSEAQPIPNAAGEIEGVVDSKSNDIKLSTLYSSEDIGASVVEKSKINNFPVHSVAVECISTSDDNSVTNKHLEPSSLQPIKSTYDLTIPSESRSAEPEDEWSFEDFLIMDAITAEHNLKQSKSVNSRPLVEVCYKSRCYECIHTPIFHFLSKT